MDRDMKRFFYLFAGGVSLLFALQIIMFAGMSVRPLFAAQVADVNNIQNCRAKLDAYLSEKLSGNLVEKERTLSLKPLYETCSYWLVLKATESSDATVPAELVIDAVSLNAELGELGFISAAARPIVSMASEINGKNLVESFFTAGKNSGRNECESSLSYALAARGFTPSFSDGSSERLTKMRGFRPVMARYKDLSALPNFFNVNPQLCWGTQGV
jgi:hypothetical protein